MRDRLAALRGRNQQGNADRAPIVPPPLHQCCYCHRIFDPLAPSEGYLVDGDGRIRCRDCNTKN